MTYDSYVSVVDSHGFEKVVKNTTLVYMQSQLALRLDGSSQTLAVKLKPEVIPKLKEKFQAKVLFYYDGSTEGRIMSIGDGKAEAGADCSPGWSISVQPGILTVHVCQDGKRQIHQRCVMNIPKDGRGGWFTAVMTLNEAKALISSIKPGDNAEEKCTALPASFADHRPDRLQQRR